MTDASRRAVLGAAAWGLPAVTVATAAPAFAATSDTGPKVVNSQREGANFRIRIESVKTIAAVTIGGVVAKFSKQQGEWTAKLQRQSDSTQSVIVTFTDSTTATLAVYFRE